MVAAAAVALGGCAGATVEDFEPAPPLIDAVAEPDAEATLAASGAVALGLVGLTGDEARSRLGPPGVLRRERWAEFWRYRLEPCVLDLYLYEEAASRPRVLYAELRRGRQPAQPGECRSPVVTVGGRGV